MSPLDEANLNIARRGFLIDLFVTDVSVEVMPVSGRTRVAMDVERLTAYDLYHKLKAEFDQ